VRYAEAVVRVKWYSLLAERSLSGRDAYQVPFREGLRPIDLIHAEGFYGDEAEAIVVIVNDEHAGRETPLRDGDSVELMINMVGGAGQL
jgi:molybdopterin converting factor small subunit